jgi:XRE family aerobic/anaerobic benzoate catabolism transcriptional regulator
VGDASNVPSLPRYPELEPFGDAVRTRRLELKLSQERLAFQVGVSSNYVSTIERGRCNPGLLRLVKLAAALGATLDDLVPASMLSDPRILGQPG